MVSEEKAREIIIKDVYKRIDAMGYGAKQNGLGSVSYNVKGKQMTLAEYQAYCIKQELKKFGIKMTISSCFKRRII